MKKSNIKSKQLLGKKLKYLREVKGFTLNIFAEETNMSSATVSRIENGLVDVKFSTLIKYAEGLNIPISYIFSDKYHYMKESTKDIVDNENPTMNSLIVENENCIWRAFWE